jgi:5'-3' exonuclease
VKTLLIDGEWNLKRNFMKRDTMFSKGEHCGGSFGFLESLRAVVNKTMPDRVVVMWDGIMGGKLRHEIYSRYKENRNKSWDENSYMLDDYAIAEEEKKKYSILQQKIKVKNYLEELFIRQAEVDCIEADDLIALYVKKRSSEEQVIIFSTDKDYVQLVDDGVCVLRPSDDMMITKENFKQMYGYTHENALALRCFEGDVSDNIQGVDGIGYKTVVKYFPRFVDEEYTVDRIISEAVEMYQKKKIKFFEKIIGCRRTFERNKKLMDLKNPMINDDAEREVSDVKECIIALEDDRYAQRSISNAAKMMVADGYNTLVWKENMEFFLRPFHRLVAKEKEFTKKATQNNTTNGQV